MSRFFKRKANTEISEDMLLLGGIVDDIPPKTKAAPKTQTSTNKPVTYNSAPKAPGKRTNVQSKAAQELSKKIEETNARAKTLFKRESIDTPENKSDETKEQEAELTKEEKENEEKLLTELKQTSEQEQESEIKTEEVPEKGINVEPTPVSEQKISLESETKVEAIPEQENATTAVESETKSDMAEQEIQVNTVESVSNVEADEVVATPELKEKPESVAMTKKKKLLFGDSDDLFPSDQSTPTPKMSNISDNKADGDSIPKKAPSKRKVSNAKKSTDLFGDISFMVPEREKEKMDRKKEEQERLDMEKAKKEYEDRQLKKLAQSMIEHHVQTFGTDPTANENKTRDIKRRLSNTSKPKTDVKVATSTTATVTSSTDAKPEIEDKSETKPIEKKTEKKNLLFSTDDADDLFNPKKPAQKKAKKTSLFGNLGDIVPGEENAEDKAEDNKDDEDDDEDDEEKAKKLEEARKEREAKRNAERLERQRKREERLKLAQDLAAQDEEEFNRLEAEKKAADEKIAVELKKLDEQFAEEARKKAEAAAAAASQAAPENK